jgi:hypothetical protein
LVENVHSRNVYFDDDSHDNTYRYGEIGPSELGSPGDLCSDLTQSGEAEGFIEYNDIHGGHDDCGGVHIDAIDLNPPDAGLGVTEIRGNHIWDCGEQCFFVGDPGTWLFENNMVEESSFAFADAQEIAGMGTGTFRFNTIDGDVGEWGKEDPTPGDGCTAPDDCRPGDVDVYGNLFLEGSPDCDDTTGIVTSDWTNNIWPTAGSTCDGAKVCTPRMSDGNLWTNTDRNANTHISNTDTCARGFGTGNPATPAKDIDGEDRPNGTTDAGADEVP